MDSILQASNRIILNPQYAELLSLVKAARNGIVYGAKVRFPHALVMVFLFRSGTIREKLRLVLKATKTHAQNLGTFVFLYKACMLVLRHSTRLITSDKEEPGHNSFLAGLIAGYTVFGRGIQSSVNQQIVIYVFGRVVLGLARLVVDHGVVVPRQLRDQVSNNAWPVFAALSWAIVMWLFRWYPHVLQPSLRSSMKYLYVNADHWDGMRNFLIHNT